MKGSGKLNFHFFLFRWISEMEEKNWEYATMGSQDLGPSSPSLPHSLSIYHSSLLAKYICLLLPSYELILSWVCHLLCSVSSHYLILLFQASSLLFITAMYPQAFLRGKRTKHTPFFISLYSHKAVSLFSFSLY